VHESGERFAFAGLDVEVDGDLDLPSGGVGLAIGAPLLDPAEPFSGLPDIDRSFAFNAAAPR